MQRDYVGLHNHTEYSNLKVIDSVNRFERMVDYAWDLNLSGLALTDHDCLSGTLQALDIYKEKIHKEWTALHSDTEYPGIAAASQELDFKIILGNEIYLSEDGLDKDKMAAGEPAHFWHIILLAKDAIGFQQLKELSSRAWNRAWVTNILRTPTYPSDLIEVVGTNPGHLVCSTACLGGYTAWCWKMATQGENLLPWEEVSTGNKDYYIQKLDSHLMAMESLFGKGNFFIELQPNEEGSDQNQYNKFMLERYWNKYSFIFTTDAHYLKATERAIHKAFLNSKSSKDREVDEFYKYTYIMSQDEIRSLMPYVTDEQFNRMVANTRYIKDMVEFFEIEKPKVIAKVAYEHWEEYKDDLDIFSTVDKETYPVFYSYIHSTNEADQYLARLIAHGYAIKYDSTWDEDIYFARIEEELDIIKQVGDAIQQSMSDYFITMSKMVDLMWSANSLVGPSRGSAGAMLINYLIDITQMDPIQMDLPYVWRFMHPSRPDYPDIDVDSESDKRAIVFETIRNYFRQLGGDVVNVCTFGTEGTKSAIKTAGRGLKIDDDIITYITAMIPNERGFDWSLHDCYYGNGNDRQPIAAFVEQMNQNKDLWELAQNIEGLVTRLGVHASGVVCVNGPFVQYNSILKTSRGQIVSAYDLHTLERCGVLKYDLLTVSALDRIHQCMNYMLEDKVMEWQGSLRETYNKYLNPAVLDYTSKDMWTMAEEGKISSLFQFDTNQGQIAMRQIGPQSLKELAIANSVMRLMSDGELPLEKYARYKKVPNLWYDEMYAHGLTDEEIHILEPYLQEKSGIADSQEVIMQLSMDPHISGFTMQEANKLRKTIAKKQFKEIEKVKELFFNKGQALGTSNNLLSYIWYNCVSAQLGYSFSTIHTTGYSLIAVQEMNLAYHFPVIYWNCACLSVDSSAINGLDFNELIEDDIISAETSEKTAKNKTDYAKLASALDHFSSICKIELPDINHSKLGFMPSQENNSILYGLKGITKITDPVITEIMMHRPFTSLDDFLKKVTKRIITKDKVINLIKCGAFNALEGKTTEELLKYYIGLICEPKSNLTMQNANMLIDLYLLPNDLNYQAEVYKLTKELRRHRDKDKLWYCADRLDIPLNKVDMWKKIFADSNIIGQEIVLADEPRKVINSQKWDVFYEQQMAPLRKYITDNKQTLLAKLNNRLFTNEYQKYCSGDLLQWELDSMNFYFSGHPLQKVIKQLPYVVNSVDDIVEGAQDGFFYIKGKEIPRMKLYTLAGTVIDKDTTKGLVSLQCPSGVVCLKIYKNLFATLAATISEVDISGEKEIEQDSFFEKGTHLLVTGIQRGATFVPKTYKSTGRNSILRIVLDEDGDFVSLEEKQDA